MMRLALLTTVRRVSAHPRQNAPLQAQGFFEPVARAGPRPNVRVANLLATPVGYEACTALQKALVAEVAGGAEDGNIGRAPGGL